jgi:hypothetical protein
MGLLLLSGDDGRAEATASACSCVIVLLPLPILVCGGTNAVAVSGRDAKASDDASFMVMERLRRLLDRNGMLRDGSLKEFMMYWVWTSPPPTYLHNDESSLHGVHLIELAIGCLVTGDDG